MTEKKRDLKDQPKSATPKREVVERRDTSHKLFVWMRDHGLSDERFGARLTSPERPKGISKRTVYRWLAEGLMPSLDLVQQIYDETDGYVGLMDWKTPYVTTKKAALQKAMAGRRKAGGATKAKPRARRKASPKPKAKEQAKA